MGDTDPFYTKKIVCNFINITTKISLLKVERGQCPPGLYIVPPVEEIDSNNPIKV